MKKYILVISLLIAVVVVGIAACSKSDSSSTPTKPTTPTTTPDATVSISNFAFVPATVTIKAGGTVQWTNADSAPHTATDLNSAFTSGNLAQGDKYSFKFTTPGTYTYHCLVHSMMANATVVVTQ